MNKNLVLFGIFISLLVATYVFQEIRTKKEYVQATLADRLIDFEVTHLKLPKIEAEKKKGSWFAGDLLLSHNTFKQIERKLTEIKKIKDIQGEWATYFPYPFSFEINHEKWTIGDLSLDKQAFYLSRGDKIYLAVVEGESTQLTKSAAEIASIKLNELVSSLSKSKEALIENQLFRFYPDLPMDNVLISVEGNLPFELNLKDNQTLPPPFLGVFAHRDLRGKFFSMLTQTNIRNEIPYDEKMKYKQLGSLKFMNTKTSILWELWLKNKNSADAVIFDTVNKRSYLMVGATLKLFFVRLQDYWDKKAIPFKDFVSFTSLTTQFTQGSKTAKVTIINKEPLEFEAGKFKIDQLKMEQLIQLIFNLGPKDQADRVSPLSASEKKQVLSEEHLKIEAMGQELLLWRKAEELIVVNLTQGFKAHFNVLDENFRGTFEDVLK
jgi:hypothetical protein